MEVTLDTWATACRDAARTVGLPDLTGLDPAGEGDGRNQGTDAGLVRAAERCLALSNLAAWALDGRRATMAEDAIVARGEDATPETLAAEAARQARHAATVTLGTGLSEIEVTQARAREGLERLADTVREGVQRREAPVAGHEDERARCQEAIMQGGTLYDMERELLLESYTTDDGPTVEAFAVTPSELEEARKAWGSEAGSFEAEPGTHLLTYSLDDMRDRAALVDLMAAEAPRMAKGLVSDSETLGGLTDDVRTFEAQQKIRRDVESIADPEVSEDRVAGVLETLDSEDFYSSEAGLLVVSYMMAGNTPRDVEVWKVSPPVLSDALARLDARRGPDELMPTLADTTDLLPDQPIVIDSSDTRELRQLAQAIASPANGFVAGGEWESQSRSERTGAFRADEAGRAALASAVEAAEPPQDLEAATRAVAASGDLVSPT